MSKRFLEGHERREEDNFLLFGWWVFLKEQPSFPLAVLVLLSALERILEHF